MHLSLFAFFFVAGYSPQSLISYQRATYPGSESVLFFRPAISKAQRLTYDAVLSESLYRKHVNDFLHKNARPWPQRKSLPMFPTSAFALGTCAVLAVIGGTKRLSKKCPSSCPTKYCEPLLKARHAAPTKERLRLARGGRPSMMAGPPPRRSVAAAMPMPTRRPRCTCRQRKGTIQS